MQWHPDKFQDEEDKKTAEKKFMDIASAKEVLLDPGQFKHPVTHGNDLIALIEIGWGNKNLKD